MDKQKFIIFNGERFANESTEKQMQMLGALAFMLSVALDCEDKKQAWETLNQASQIGHLLDCPAFNTLYVAASVENTRNFMKKDSQKRKLFQKIKEAFTWKR